MNTTFLHWALFAIAALEAVGGLFTVTRVGKPRKPLTGGDAATVIVMDAAIAVLLILAGMQL